MVEEHEEQSKNIDADNADMLTCYELRFTFDESKEQSGKIEAGEAMNTVMPSDLCFDN